MEEIFTCFCKSHKFMIKDGKIECCECCLEYKIETNVKPSTFNIDKAVYAC